MSLGKSAATVQIHNTSRPATADRLEFGHGQLRRLMDQISAYAELTDAINGTITRLCRRVVKGLPIVVATSLAGTAPPACRLMLTILTHGVSCVY